MSSTTRRNIGIGALLVIVVFVVIMIQDRTRLNQIEPALMAIKDHVSKIPEKISPLFKPSGSSAPASPYLEKLRRNGMVLLPEKEVMKSMSAEALIQTYHSYLDNIEIRCNRKLRMGKVGDGGWEICDDEKYRPSHNCVVYSFGINNDFSFDDDISRVYQCSVIAFDPSMKRESYQRSRLVYFLKMGIAEKTYDTEKHWQLRTLGFFLRKFNHTNRVIDVLKMDVESAEWPSLPEMVRSGHLRYVKQLLMEYHGRPTKKNTLLSELTTLKDLYDIGFRKFYVHKNFHCGYKEKFFPVSRTSCYEVHYVNVNLL